MSTSQVKPPGKRGTSRKKTKKKADVLLGADDVLDAFYDDTLDTVDTYYDHDETVRDTPIEVEHNDIDNDPQIKKAIEIKQDPTDTNVEKQAISNGDDSDIKEDPIETNAENQPMPNSEDISDTKQDTLDDAVPPSTTNDNMDNDMEETEQEVLDTAKQDNTDDAPPVTEEYVIDKISNIEIGDDDTDDKSSKKYKIPTKSKSKPLPKRIAKPLPLRDAKSKPLPPTLNNGNKNDSMKPDCLTVEPHVDKTHQTWVIAKPKPKPKALSPKTLKPLTPTSPKPPTPTFDPQTLESFSLSPKQKRALLQRNENS